MSKLSAFIKKNKPPTTKDLANDKRTSSFISIKKINPRHRYYLGKTIAFSIDNGAVQISVVKHGGKSIKIICVEKEYFPKENFDEVAKQKFIINKIDEIINKYGGLWTEVLLSLSGNKTTYRTFLMPALNKKELTSAIQYEVKKQIPFPIEDCYYDYRSTYKIKKENTCKYKIALHAVTKDIVNQQLSYFNPSGIDVAKIYSADEAMGELLSYLTDFDKSDNYILLNLGLSSIDISFYKGSILEFSHHSSLNSNLLGANPKSTKYEYFAELIINEVQNSLDYYAGQYSSDTNNKIFVYGDFAYSLELLNLLNNKKNLELTPFPVEKLSFLSRQKDGYIQTIPVCLSSFATSICKTELANLIAPEEKRTQHQNRINKYLQIGLIILVLSGLYSWVYKNNDLKLYHNNLKSITRQVDKFKNSDAFHSYNLIKRKITIDEAYLNKIKQSSHYFSLNLKELSHITPVFVTLTNLDYNPNQTDNNYFLQGFIQSENIPPEIILAEYVENLLASPFFDKVKIIKHTRKNEKNISKLEFQIKMLGVS